MKKMNNTKISLKRVMAVIMLFTLMVSLNACGVRDKAGETSKSVVVKEPEATKSGEIKEPEATKSSGTKEPEVEPGDVSGDLPLDTPIETVTLDDETRANLYDATGEFAFELLRNCDKSERNILISPTSVMLALGMTANGGTGETLKEMENVLGGEGADLESINAFYKEYADKLQEGEEIKVNIANSIWVNKDAIDNVKDVFVSTLQNFYGSQIYKETFDSNTVEMVNNWVKENTDGMIEKLLDQFEGSEVMILINAICFDGEWEEIYYEDQVRETKFTTATGGEVEVEGMYSDEDLYIEDENTTGVIKDYKGGYSFVALLPSEDVSIDDYVANLTYDKYESLMDSKREAIVQTMLPKFQYDYSEEMDEALMEMGMSSAFEKTGADFSNMTEDDIEMYIGKVLHKTYIEVGEKGTRAAAVTAVLMDGCEAFEEKEVKSVTLDRPFVYMIIDKENEMPLFIGVVRDI